MVKRLWWIAVVLLGGCAEGTSSGVDARPPADLALAGGRIVDGLGQAAYAGDLVILDGRIVDLGVGAAERWRAGETIDAAGRVIAPGFIDPHAHGDPFATPAFENFLAMGVTTIVLGQDGASPDVENLGAWLDGVAAQGVGTNLALFVGHGTLREQSGVGLEPDPSTAQIESMAARLDAALEHTFGLSTGLEYNPGLHAPAAELDALARVVGRHGRMIMSHLRSEDDDALADSIAELERHGAHARVHIAHLKSVYGKGAARGAEILELLAAARRRGVVLTADTYPYTASYTGLALLFPVWAKTAEQLLVARAERRDELAAYLRDHVTARNGPEATLLGTAPHAGKTLADLSRELEMPFEDVLIDVLGPDGGYAAYFVMDESLQTALLADPFVTICSDGGPTTYHPRGHGAFAKVIEHHVVRDGVLTLEAAVAKMSAVTAGMLGLEDRGRLAKGMHADVIVFDPLRVRALASYLNPQVLAQGFDLVLVNGRVARRDGAMSDMLHGAVLRPRNDSEGS